MSDSKDYYKLLGVNEDASPEQIKKSFRQLSMKYHPDRNNGDKESEEMFKKINEAYSILSDPNKRQEYDNPMSNMSGFGGFGGFDPFAGMGDIFGFGRGGPNSGPKQNRPMKGKPIKTSIDVPLSSFLLGTTLNLNLNYKDSCKTCSGTGAKTSESCKHCGGSGMLMENRMQGHMNMFTQTPCPICRGQGRIGIDKCDECEGGTINISKAIELEIRPGTKDGEILAFSGQGGNGLFGGPQGDVLVQLNMVVPNLSSLSDEEKDLLKRLLNEQ